MTVRDQLCLALDVDTVADAEEWVRKTRDRITTFKVGLQLFSLNGPKVIEAVQKAGAERIFLDLKLHDIPNTVAATIMGLRGLGVHYTTIHLAGGIDMQKAAVEAAGPVLRVLGVTVLTSVGRRDLANGGTPGDVTEITKARALAAKAVKIPGLICAATEVAEIRQLMGPGWTLVTPGIRLPRSGADDQRRVATPKSAIQNGATMLVLGRTITNAGDPQQALTQVYQSIAN